MITSLKKNRCLIIHIFILYIHILLISFWMFTSPSEIKTAQKQLFFFFAIKFRTFMLVCFIKHDYKMKLTKIDKCM